MTAYRGSSGMMWWWNTKADLQQAILQAIEHYEQTRGRRPLICYANKEIGPQEVDGVQVHPLHNMIPAHLWLLEQEIESGSEGEQQS